MPRIDAFRCGRRISQRRRCATVGVSKVAFGTATETLRALGWNAIDISAAELASRPPFNPCTISGGVLEAQSDALFEEEAVASGA